MDDDLKLSRHDIVSIESLKLIRLAQGARDARRSIEDMPPNSPRFSHWPQTVRTLMIYDLVKLRDAFGTPDFAAIRAKAGEVATRRLATELHLLKEAIERVLIEVQPFAVLPTASA